MSKLFLPQGFSRDVPSSFASQLKELDQNLIVYFNPHKQRWVIDRCTRDGPMKIVPHMHTPECPRTNVIVVKDSEGAYMPLCDQIFDELRSMDSWKCGSAEEFQRQGDARREAYEASLEKQVDEIFSNASRDNRRQLMKAYDLTQIHDVARVNQ